MRGLTGERIGDVHREGRMLVSADEAREREAFCADGGEEALHAALPPCVGDSDAE